MAFVKMKFRGALKYCDKYFENGQHIEVHEKDVEHIKQLGGEIVNEPVNETGSTLHEGMENDDSEFADDLDFVANEHDVVETEAPVAPPKKAGRPKKV